MGRTYFIKLPEKGSFGLQNFNDGFDNQIRIFCRNCEIFGKTKTFVNIINFRCLQLSFFYAITQPFTGKILGIFQNSCYAVGTIYFEA